MIETDHHLNPPVMENIDRKLKIQKTEWYLESKFENEDVAALYFFWNPTEGPFIIIPCLEKEGA